VLDVLRYLLLAVEVVSSILLVGVILLQKPRGQGLGISFGAGMGETLFGPRMGNVLTRATVILAIVFLVNTAILALLGSSSRVRSAVDGVPAAPARPVDPMRSQARGPAGEIPSELQEPAVDTEMPVQPVVVDTPVVLDTPKVQDSPHPPVESVPAPSPQAPGSTEPDKPPAE